jgi:hypothetical protein
MFLIPIATFGYSVWETKKKEREEQRRISRLGEATTTSRDVLLGEPRNYTTVQTIDSAPTSDSLETLSLEEAADGGPASELIIVEVGAYGEQLPSATPDDADTTTDLYLQVDSSSVCEQDDEAEVERLMIATKNPECEEAPTPSPLTPLARAPQGPIQSLMQFIQEGHKLFAENPEPWSIKTNTETLTYEVLGHQGKRKE